MDENSSEECEVTGLQSNPFDLKGKEVIAGPSYTNDESDKGFGVDETGKEVDNSGKEIVDELKEEDTFPHIDAADKKGKGILEVDPDFDLLEFEYEIDNYVPSANEDSPKTDIPNEGHGMHEDSSEDDEDFSMANVDEDHDMFIDDVLFEDNVDRDVEMEGAQMFLNDASETDYTDTSMQSSEQDFSSQQSSEGEGYDKSQNVFQEVDIFKPTFALGQIFSSKKLFREAVHSHAIQSRRNLKITKNDKRRIYARCAEEGCDWHINALKKLNEESFEIREYNSKHKCGRSFTVRNVTAGWLASKYEEKFRCDPKKKSKSVLD